MFGQRDIQKQIVSYLMAEVNQNTQNIPLEAILLSHPLSNPQDLGAISLECHFSDTFHLLPVGSGCAGRTSLPQMLNAATAVTIPANPI